MLACKVLLWGQKLPSMSVSTAPWENEFPPSEKYLAYLKLFLLLLEGLLGSIDRAEQISLYMETSPTVTGQPKPYPTVEKGLYEPLEWLVLNWFEQKESLLPMKNSGFYPALLFKVKFPKSECLTSIFECSGSQSVICRALGEPLGLFQGVYKVKTVILIIPRYLPVKLVPKYLCEARVSLYPSIQTVYPNKLNAAIRVNLVIKEIYKNM